MLYVCMRAARPSAAAQFGQVTRVTDRSLTHDTVRLRWLVWLSGGSIRWATVETMLEARYVDAYRCLHADERGFTFPSTDPHIRLDYAFVPAAFAARLKGCRIVNDSLAAAASDHLPMVVEW